MQFVIKGFFMGRFRRWLAVFLYGRNGPDQLYNFLMWTAAILLLISIVIRAFVSYVAGIILYAVAILLMIYALSRVFSKNVSKRAAENERFLRLKFKIKAFFTRQKNRRKYKDDFIYTKCPSCKNVLRFKRVPGTHTAKCPCCKYTFEINIK